MKKGIALLLLTVLCLANYLQNDTPDQDPVIGGYVIDWLTIDVLFYVSALLYASSAWVTWRWGKISAMYIMER